MKKKVIGLMLAVMVMGTLVGCGSKTECDFCGEMKNCSTRTVWGEEINYCRDCQDEINGFFK